MLITKEIVFTKADAAELFPEYKDIKIVSVCNSKVITKMICDKLGGFPQLDIIIWELIDDSNVFYERYRLVVIMKALFCDN